MTAHTEEKYFLILKNIERYISLNEDEKNYFVGILLEEQFKKKSFLLKQGQINTGTWFVNKGCLRIFNTDADGVEHIMFFSPQDWWMSDMYSVITGQASQLNIQAVEETSVLFMSKIAQDELCTKVPKFDRYFRILLEKNHVATQNLLMERMTKTAQERYTKFTTRYPSLVSSLAQKQIASYIGITPEFLSKIRTELFKKP